MASKFCSKYICLPGLFYIKLFICPSDIKGQNLPAALHRESPPRLRYESVAELTAPWDPHLHFTTFENSVLQQKTDISRTAWINPWSFIKHKILLDKTTALHDTKQKNIYSKQQ